MLVQRLLDNSSALLVPRFRRVTETVRGVCILKSRGDLVHPVARRSDSHVQEKLGFCGEDVKILSGLGKGFDRFVNQELEAL